MPGGANRRGTLSGPSSAPATGERIDVLTAGSTWRIEQILSGVLPEPVSDLLDHDEWVVVLNGRAELDVEGAVERLDPGDWIRLGPGVAHRVLFTAPGTNWLAVHVGIPAGSKTSPTPAPR